MFKILYVNVFSYFKKVTEQVNHWNFSQSRKEAQIHTIKEIVQE